MHLQETDNVSLHGDMEPPPALRAYSPAAPSTGTVWNYHNMEVHHSFANCVGARGDNY